jgi:four helix bundle protein
MGDYRKLQVYERSYEKAKEIYVIANRFPKDEQYGLVSQIKRAAMSIPLNIAEGYGKQDGTKELLRYLRMARGSCAEVSVLIDFARDFGFMTKEEGERLQRGYEEIGKMLTGLLKALKAENNEELMTND